MVLFSEDFRFFLMGLWFFVSFLVVGWGFCLVLVYFVFFSCFGFCLFIFKLRAIS